MSDTIVAIATPPGRGGVGIVRLSGPEALSIGKKITQQDNLMVRHAVFSAFYSENQQMIDKGIVIYFKAPHSFTGEEIIELHAHGSPILLDNIVQACIHLGARMARPGEFSERAYLNDKIDLTQAEAIADLIAANSEQAARMALHSLQGEFSKAIHSINQQIIALRMYVEAAIDFPEEEIDFVGDGYILKTLLDIIESLKQLQAQASQGVIIQEGLTVAIVGAPNAGKSTLINQLSGQDVAIVTNIAGTTRDVMRETILIDELPIHLVDTAGLRDSDDVVEQEGIRRAWNEVKKADCVVLIQDINQSDEIVALEAQIKAALASDIPMIRLFNKIDSVSMNAQKKGFDLYISAKENIGIDLLKQCFKDIAGITPTEGRFLARRRHLVALTDAHLQLTQGLHQLTSFKAAELLAEDLRLAHRHLGDIIGEFSSDDLLGEIFSSFCIGK